MRLTTLLFAGLLASTAASAQSPRCKPTPGKTVPAGCAQASGKAGPGASAGGTEPAHGLRAPGQSSSLYQLGGGLGTQGGSSSGSSAQLGLRSPGKSQNALRSSPSQ